MVKNRRQSMREFVSGESINGSEQTLPLSAIILPAYQPRTLFDEERLNQMAQNIKVQGILNRLIVRRILGTDQYELVAGGRRYRAAKIAGLNQVPVLVKKLTDEQAWSLALSENLQREDLKPIEETESILKLIELKLGRSNEDIQKLLIRMYNDSKRKSTTEQNVLFTDEAEAIRLIFNELAAMTWESFVTSRLPLLSLPSELLEALRENKIAYTKAAAIGTIKDPTLRAALLEEAITKNLSLSAIKAKIKSLESDKEAISPKQTIKAVTLKITKSKVWEDPKKWKQVQNLLKKLEALVTE